MLTTRAYKQNSDSALHRFYSVTLVKTEQYKKRKSKTASPIGEKVDVYFQVFFAFALVETCTDELTVVIGTTDSCYSVKE
jgi:hypothetical protein